MIIAYNLVQLRDSLSGVEPLSIGFIPTMGALHPGHLSLIDVARSRSDFVVVSIFVNPTQFNDPHDLASYPRTPERDIELLSEVGIDLLFMPSAEEIYPEIDIRQFDFGDMERVMEGATRPGHFSGVAQVVSRLFALIAPARAYFGEKDFQQVAIIRALVTQLGLGVDIVACPTVRESDGLAMSSRNSLLSVEHRSAAPKIYSALLVAFDYLNSYLAQASGDVKASISPRDLERFVVSYLHEEVGDLLQVIYFNIVNSATLAPADDWFELGGIRGCIAVQAGDVRLIDNIRFV